MTLPNEPLVEVDYSEFTVAELKDLLDDRGVNYTSGDLKADLINLAEGSES